MGKPQVSREFAVNVWADGMILPQGDGEDLTFSGVAFASRKRLDSGVHIVVRARHRGTGEVIGQHKLQKLIWILTAES